MGNALIERVFQTVSVVVFDDQPVHCESITAMLSIDSALRVLGRASSPAEAIGRLQLRPDVVVLSGDFTGDRGLGIVKSNRSGSDEPGVLVLTHSEAKSSPPAGQLGGESAIWTKSPVRDLIEAVHRVHLDRAGGRERGAGQS